MQAEVLTLGYNQNTTLLASGGVDRSVLLWSHAQDYDNIAVLKGHTNAITSLVWTYTDRLLTASADKSLVCWDV
jgi:WD40 repeat protein